MTTTRSCESCGMPIETGRYCGHCTDETGQLQSFEQRFERMTAWQARRHPGAAREEIERQTLEYMATMPAWRDHPASRRRPADPRAGQAACSACSWRTTSSASLTCWPMLVIELKTCRTVPWRSIT